MPFKKIEVGLQTPLSPQAPYIAFPIGYVGSLRWRWGLKTNFKFCLKGIFVQKGSSGTCFDHGQFEIKTFPIYTPPYQTASLGIEPLTPNYVFLS